MIDSLIWLTGPASGVACYALGYAIGRRNRSASLPVRSPEPICGCEHPLAVHDPETGRCCEKVPVDWYERSGAYRLTGNCACRQYTGPKPIDQVFQPRFTLPEEP